MTYTPTLTSKPMKNIFLFLVPAMLAAGCAEQIELVEPGSMTGDRETVPEQKTRSIEGAVYNEAVDAWMIPQKDPYALENFQNAYDNLAAGKSAQSLTKAQAAEFTLAKKLSPTHYALKIYPRNEEEQWRVETMKGIQVAYIPFDHVQLTQEEVENLPQAQVKTRSAADTFVEKSPYSVTYDYIDVFDGGPTGPVTYQLPIIYTVWPVDKPLPDDLQYVVDYEVFLPHVLSTKIQETETMSILEFEAITTALGVSPTWEPAAATRAAAQTNQGLYGYIQTYDSTSGVQRNVPMANIKISWGLGSAFRTDFTDAAGFFSFEIPIPWNPSFNSINTDFTFTYQDPQSKWKITTEGSTSPHSVVVNAKLGLWSVWDTGPHPPGYSPDITLPTGNRQANEIWRAANFFFNGQTVFPKNVLSGGMRIIANSGPHSGGADGGFAPTSRDIFIYKNRNNPHGFVIGATLHEIGHYIDCYNNSTRMLNSPLFLSEAFSGYIGWYLTHEYYKLQGRTAAPGEDLTDNGMYGNARQEWDKYSSNNYTPLFVDLTDNYNQCAVSYPDRPNDNITNVPASVIWSTITTINSWTQCRSKLQGYSGTGTGKHYTTAQFAEWIDAFDDNPYIY